MKRQRKVLIICSLTVVCMLSVLFFFYIRADLWFYLEETLRPKGEPRLTETVIDEGVLYSFDELATLENVDCNNTLMLVNRENPLPVDYEADIVEYNGARMHPHMVDAYIALRDRVQERTHVRIYVASDYRTREEQAEILLESEEGTAAPLGCSEHEAGLALDVYAPYFAGMEFLRSPAGRDVNRICKEHGFIIRYPRNKESVTSIAYEPWHLRYVGLPHATVMTDADLTLEEYVAYLTPEIWFQCEEYLILRTEKDSVLLPYGWESCEFSPDNTGYRIITVKMS